MEKRWKFWSVAFSELEGTLKYDHISRNIKKETLKEKPKLQSLKFDLLNNFNIYLQEWLNWVIIMIWKCAWMICLT